MGYVFSTLIEYLTYYRMYSVHLSEFYIVNNRLFFLLIMHSVSKKGFGINIATNTLVTLTCDGKSVKQRLQL